MKSLGEFDGLSVGNDFDIWYAKDNAFRDLSLGIMTNFDPKDISKTHVLLGTMGPVKRGNSDNEDIYVSLQGEIWSPDGEANDLIRSKGLSHTSMSIGDIIVDKKANKTYMVAMMGFKEIV